MKNYVDQIIDLTGDGYLNPAWPQNRRSVSSITSIIVHHDAVVRPHDYDSVARYRNEAAEHYNRLGPGIQYHYKIDNTGQIFKLRPHELATWHASNYPVNLSSLAICVDGYFHPPQNQQPTREQLEALEQLLTHLCTQHPEFPASQGDVYGHREVAEAGYGTACPGDLLFPYVVQYRQIGGIIVPPSIDYDWPDQQPSAAPSNTPQPEPIPPVVEISYRVVKDGKQIGAYKLDTNAWNKYKAEGGTIVDQTGKDVTELLRAKFELPISAPTPDTIPSPTAQDETKQNQDLNKQVAETHDIVLKNNTILTKLLSLVKQILSLLRRKK